MIKNPNIANIAIKNGKFVLFLLSEVVSFSTFLTRRVIKIKIWKNLMVTKKVTNVRLLYYFN